MACFFHSFHFVISITYCFFSRSFSRTSNNSPSPSCPKLLTQLWGDTNVLLYTPAMSHNHIQHEWLTQEPLAKWGAPKVSLSSSTRGVMTSFEPAASVDMPGAWREGCFYPPLFMCKVCACCSQPLLMGSPREVRSGCQVPTRFGQPDHSVGTAPPVSKSAWSVPMHPDANWWLGPVGASKQPY